MRCTAVGLGMKRCRLLLKSRMFYDITDSVYHENRFGNQSARKGIEEAPGKRQISLTDGKEPTLMEQVFQFDTIHSRIPGNCKWTGMEEILPMSVADMDFASPPCVVSALQERAAKGLFGYQVLTEQDYAAIIDWRMRRHGEVLRREWLLATPGVLNTMRAAVYALTNPGDRVIVQTPLHTPSITSASMRGRECLDVPLRLDEHGCYRMDYAGLERAFASGARVMTLCSPSNPTGRVWTYEELEQLARLVEKYDVHVIADEIHADILYRGAKHISLRTLPGMGRRVISTFSPSKSFNFGGFHIATAVIEDDDLRKRLSDLLYEAGICCGRPGAMEITAQTAAYTQGEAWLDALIEYLDGNITYVLEELKDTPFRAYRPESSILMWIDCSAMEWDTPAYHRAMQAAGLQPDPGHYYFMDNHHTGCGRWH